jgi:hypothetical protein
MACRGTALLSFTLNEALNNEAKLEKNLATAVTNENYIFGEVKSKLIPVKLGTVQFTIFYLSAFYLKT